MKQPELGRKISELRKAKALTQEELVEKCNISVRTLQRIETGEVTPRSYTIRTILAALDYDLSIIGEDEPAFHNRLQSTIRKYLLPASDPAGSADMFVTQLTVAWIFGVLYFLTGFFEGAAEYFRFKENELIFGTTTYIVIKITGLISYVLFQRGFLLLGGYYKNYLLRIVSFLLIFGNILVAGYDIASLYYDSIERQFILGSEAIVFGCIGVLYGISLVRLRKPIGPVAAYAGIFEIVAGCFFITVILSFLGFIIAVPAELFQIILLYKSTEIIRTEQEASGSLQQMQ